jgi:NTE family protein
MPVELNGQRLVDGGVLNNLPVDAAKQLGADVVVAVNVEPNPQGGSGGWVGDYRWLPEGLSRTLTVLDEAARLMLATIQEDRLSQNPPDVLIHPHLPSGVNLLVGYSRVAELIATGEHAAEEALPDIRRILHTRNTQPLDSRPGMV